MIPDPSLIGRQFANFRIERLLGRGGMAEVYFGWDVKLQRPVAIKVIDARYRDNPAYAQRFVNEARAMAAWHHPNIVQIYYADNEQGYYYYAMEYIHGINLEQALQEYAQKQEFMPLVDVIRVGRAAASALDYAHANGVVHRDVKPSNLLISADGRIMLTDFGLAKHIDRGTIGTAFGSPHYIAPEQARNSAEAVPQSDLYALGVILYELLTGAVPFDDPSPTALALQHITMEPPPPRQVNPSLSPAVEAVLLKALKKSPLERYQTGKALIDALEEALFTTAYTTPVLRSSPVAGTVRRTAYRVSRTPLSDIVASWLAKQPALPASEELATFSMQPEKPAAKTTRFPRLPWWGIGCGTLLGLALLFFVITLLINNHPVLANLPQESTRTAVSTDTLQASETAAQAAIASATAPLETQAPTITPSLTPTLAPSTATPAPSSTATSPPLKPTPTPIPPNQNHFILFYDDTSFYIKNGSKKDWSIYDFAFERLGKNDVPANRFDGWILGNIYSKFRSGYCMVVEIINYTNHLNPPDCKNRYLVIHRPTADQSYIFWTRNNNSTVFRVLWKDQEVGRCFIANHKCDIYLPPDAKGNNK